jgi:hypothetical protein
LASNAVVFYAWRAAAPGRIYPAGEKFDDVPPKYRVNINVHAPVYNRREGGPPPTAAEVQRRLAEAWSAFLIPVSDPARGFVTIVAGRGEDAVARAYDELVAGRARPGDGHLLSLVEPEDVSA